MDIKITKSKISYIAEIGWNFMGDMDLASRMITDAKRADASIVKFQYWIHQSLYRSVG